MPLMLIVEDDELWKEKTTKVGLYRLISHKSYVKVGREIDLCQSIELSLIRYAIRKLGSGSGSRIDVTPASFIV